MPPECFISEVSLPVMTTKTPLGWLRWPLSPPSPGCETEQHREASNIAHQPGMGNDGEPRRSEGHNHAPKNHAQIQENFLHWKYWEGFKPGDFDVISASVPCEHCSMARTRSPRDIAYANRLVKKTIEIIRFFKPTKFTKTPRVIYSPGPQHFAPFWLPRVTNFSTLQDFCLIFRWPMTVLGELVSAFCTFYWLCDSTDFFAISPFFA